MENSWWNSILPKMQDNRSAMMMAGLGLLSGQTPQQGFANIARTMPMGMMMDQNRRQQTQQQAQRNKTMDYFKANRPDLYQQVEAGMPMGEAWKIANQKPDVQKPTALMQNYEYAKRNGFTGNIMDYQLALKKAGATNVNVGDNAPGLGKLSSDYGYVLDPETRQPVIGQNGLPQAAAIPGSPAALKQQQAEQAAQVKQQSTARSGNVVLEDIDRALAGMNQDTLPTTGPLGGALANVPGTQAFDVGQLIETIKANSGFDRLQAMRDSSPTGGALGAINQSEMGLLQAALGNLSQSQSREQLEYNLKRVRRIYDEIINGPADSRANPAAQQPGQQPQGRDGVTRSGIRYRIIE